MEVRVLFPAPVQKLRIICYSGEHPPLAQLVEQLPLKEMVLGSNPRGRTANRNKTPTGFFRLRCPGRKGGTFRVQLFTLTLFLY